MLSRPTYRLTALVLGACATVVTLAGAQTAGLSAGAWTGAGFDGSLEALGREVTGVPLLAGAELAYALPIVAKWSGGLGLGGMYVRREGEVGGEPYAARAWRFTVSPGLGYRASERLGLRGGVEVRSSADLDAFDARLDDNVRTHLRIGGDYAVTDRLSVSATLTRLLGDPGDVANLVDPGRTVRLGLSHRLTGQKDEG